MKPETMDRSRCDRPGRILVVEDDADLRALYRDLLEGEGYAVVTAGDGPSALERFDEQAPDLVVLDIHLPGMDGMELLYRLLDRRRDLPVVLNTADPTYRDSYLSWPARAFVVKSHRLTDLTRRVHDVLPNQAPGPPQGVG